MSVDERLFDGPETAAAAATAVSSWGFGWTCESIKVWQRGEVAWARCRRGAVSNALPMRTLTVNRLIARPVLQVQPLSVAAC